MVRRHIQKQPQTYASDWKHALSVSSIRNKHLTGSMYTYTPSTSRRHLIMASPSSDDPGTVVVKVHYRYTVALRVPSGTPYGELQQKIGRKLGQPSSQLRLRYQTSFHLSPVGRPIFVLVSL